MPGASYGSVVKLLLKTSCKFTEAGEVPVTILLKLLNDEQGIAHTLKDKPYGTNSFFQQVQQFKIIKGFEKENL